jgi:hypothetical protein
MKLVLERCATCKRPAHATETDDDGKCSDCSRPPALALDIVGSGSIQISAALIAADRLELVATIAAELEDLTRSGTNNAKKLDKIFDALKRRVSQLETSMKALEVEAEAFRASREEEEDNGGTDEDEDGDP